MGDVFIIVDCGAKPLHKKVSTDKMVIAVTSSGAIILLQDEMNTLGWIEQSKLSI